MTEIFTSYFANVRSLPESFEPIAICGGIPDWWNGQWTRKVAPKLSFFNEWKYNNRDNNYYIEHFNREVLDLLKPRDIASMFVAMADGKTPCLICYERPEEFCHRHLVADWLNKNLYYVRCTEYSNNLKNGETHK